MSDLPAASRSRSRREACPGSAPFLRTIPRLGVASHDQRRVPGPIPDLEAGVGRPRADLSCPGPLGCGGDGPLPGGDAGGTGRPARAGPFARIRCARPGHQARRGGRHPGHRHPVHFRPRFPARLVGGPLRRRARAAWIAAPRPSRRRAPAAACRPGRGTGAPGGDRRVHRPVPLRRPGAGGRTPSSTTSPRPRPANGSFATHFRSLHGAFPPRVPGHIPTGSRRNRTRRFGHPSDRTGSTGRRQPAGWADGTRAAGSRQAEPLRRVHRPVPGRATRRRSPAGGGAGPSGPAERRRRAAPARSPFRTIGRIAASAEGPTSSAAAAAARGGRRGGGAGP
jgi:hypothetical protein